MSGNFSAGHNDAANDTPETRIVGERVFAEDRAEFANSISTIEITSGLFSGRSMTLRQRINFGEGQDARPAQINFPRACFCNNGGLLRHALLVRASRAIFLGAFPADLESPPSFSLSSSRSCAPSFHVFGTASRCADVECARESKVQVGVGG